MTSRNLKWRNNNFFHLFIISFKTLFENTDRRKKFFIINFCFDSNSKSKRMASLALWASNGNMKSAWLFLDPHHWPGPQIQLCNWGLLCDSISLGWYFLNLPLLALEFPERVIGSGCALAASIAHRTASRRVTTNGAGLLSAIQWPFFRTRWHLVSAIDLSSTTSKAYKPSMKQFATEQWCSLRGFLKYFNSIFYN